jgi:hypothetical protein
MFPKEHGAYGQLAAPLITAAAAAGVNLAAALLAVAVVAGFLAHEPLLVLLGRRGPRARRESGGRAKVWLAATVAIALASAAAGAWSMTPERRWSLLLPAAPALAVAAAIAAKREKTAVAEVTVAVAFSLAAVPVALAAGASVAAAATIAVVFAVHFVTGTLAVRGIIAAMRGGGDPRAARAIRGVVIALTVCAAAGFALAAARGRLPWGALAAVAPGVAAASWLALRPPPPKQLRRVGWTLVTTTVVAGLVLIATL